jgi:type IV pilus assembly protein PilW
MRQRPIPAMSTRRSMAGVSLVELMIAVTLGLLILAALASVFASSSAARNEIERASRQIENGRFAMELLADDMRLAGFFGELPVGFMSPPPVLPDPCSVDPAVWRDAIPVHVQGYDNAVDLPGCLPLANLRPGTDVVVIRRAATCEAGAAGCDIAVNNQPYIQVSRCATETAVPDIRDSFVVGPYGAAVFNKSLKNCATIAGVRRYMTRVYYISNDNGRGENIPTLRRLDFNGAAFEDTPLVEGIEELNIEYGIDWSPNGVPDGRPDAYNTNPTLFTEAGCTSCGDVVAKWRHVMTARIHLLARNLEPSPDYTDNKTYILGRDQAGSEVSVSPGGQFRRHAYTGLVRMVNAAQRRETP